MVIGAIVLLYHRQGIGTVGGSLPLLAPCWWLPSGVGLGGSS